MELVAWTEATHWHRRGNGFAVEVTRMVKPRIEGFHDDGGKWLWNVYAFIFPAHPLYSKFEGENLFQDAAKDLPLHGGPSYLRVRDTAVRIGSDYSHHYDTASHDSECHQVFRDAHELFEHLSQLAREVSP